MLEVTNPQDAEETEKQLLSDMAIHLYVLS
jgi:hypothetical protein